MPTFSVPKLAVGDNRSSCRQNIYSHRNFSPKARIWTRLKYLSGLSNVAVIWRRLFACASENLRESRKFIHRRETINSTLAVIKTVLKWAEIVFKIIQ